MQKYLSLIVLLFLVGYIFMLYSCEKQTLQEENISFADTIKFSVDILPILNSCVGCHSGSTLPKLNSNPYQSLKDGNYINIKNPSQSKLYIKLTTSDSHKNYVTSTNKKKILQWITQGALNN
jgi:hypothetical protein